MKNSLPRLLAVVLLAAASYAGYRAFVFQRQAAGRTGQHDHSSQASSPNAGSDDLGVPTSAAGRSIPITAGDQLLLQAITQLESRDRDSITARLRHQVSLDGRQLFGVGAYWQQGSGESLRVRLELQIAGGEISLLHVSNGRFLWTDRRLPTGRSVVRLDLRQLRNEAAPPVSDFDAVAPGHASWSPIRPDANIHFGGLPKLLSALADSFSFLPPQAMRLTVGPPLVENEITLPVFAVAGHWKPQRLAAIVPGLSDPVVGLDTESDSDVKRNGQVPQRVPQEVLVLFGQADLFPYRIEFRKTLNPASSAGVATSADPYVLSPAPLVLLEFADVAYNVPIAAGQFDYSPGDTEWDDRTAEHIDKIRRDRRQQMAAKTDTEQAR